MRLYLVQHGRAMDKTEDPRRPLSFEGIQNARRIAGYLKENVDLSGIKHVFHSGKLRAQQTADCYAGELKLPSPEEKDGLAPMDDPSAWAARLDEPGEDILMVGHLPFMAKFASLLLSGDMDRKIVRFQMAGVVALERNDDKTWSLVWMITPEIIKIQEEADDQNEGKEKLDDVMSLINL